MKPLSLKLEKPSYEQIDVVKTESIEEKVKLLIIRDLMRLGWSVTNNGNKIEITPPGTYDKKIIRESMSIKREEILSQNREWIDKHMHYAIQNLANGFDTLDSKIIPEIEVCRSQKQHDLFRIFRYFWSSPYSEYVGRRIKLIIRDAALTDKPVIGIAALGSPIIHIPERDEYIGWDTPTRTQRLNYMMDAYVIGALPPYNYLLGGKLVSYLLASNEVRSIYEEKYRQTKFNKLAGIFTTSLYGKSSQYNRIRYKKRLLYQPIGQTKGYGTFHLSNETFNAMNDLLNENHIIVSNKFGSGPSWSMRVIRTASELLGFDADDLLRHSFKREIYFVPFASNTSAFLRGEHRKLRYYHQSVTALTNYWKKRWLLSRKKNINIVETVKWFNRESFESWLR